MLGTKLLYWQQITTKSIYTLCITREPSKAVKAGVDPFIKTLESNGDANKGESPGYAAQASSFYIRVRY